MACICFKAHYSAHSKQPKNGKLDRHFVSFLPQSTAVPPGCWTKRIVVTWMTRIVAALRLVCVSYILPEENGAAGKINQ
jgi:hypothetical protein